MPIEPSVFCSAFAISKPFQLVSYGHCRKILCLQSYYFISFKNLICLLTVSWLSMRHIWIVIFYLLFWKIWILAESVVLPMESELNCNIWRSVSHWSCSRCSWMIRKAPDGDYNWSLYGHVNKTRSHTSHQALTHFGHNKIFIMSTVRGGRQNVKKHICTETVPIFARWTREENHCSVHIFCYISVVEVYIQNGKPYIMIYNDTL